METSEHTVSTAILLLCTAFIQNVCFPCLLLSESRFCRLHSDFCFIRFLLFKSLLSMDSFNLQVWILKQHNLPCSCQLSSFFILSLYNRHFLSQVRRMRHFSRVSHSFHTSHKIPNSPCLAYRHHLLLLEPFRQGNKIHIIKQIDSLNSLLCKLDPTRLN